MLPVIEEDEILEINDYISGMFSSLYDQRTINFNSTTHEQIELLTSLEHKVLNTIEPDIAGSNDSVKNTYNKCFERTKSFYLIKVLKKLLNIYITPAKQSEIIQPKKILSYLLGEIGYLDGTGFLYTNKLYGDADLERLSNDAKLLCSYIQQISLNNNNFNFKYLNPELENSEKRNTLVSELFSDNYNQYFKGLKDKLDITADRLFRELLFHEITKLENKHIEQFIKYLSYTPANISYQKTNCPLEKQAETLLEHSNAYYLLKEGQKNLCKTLNILTSRYKTNNSADFSFTEEDKNLLLFFIWLKKKPLERLKTIERLNTLIDRQSVFALEAPNMLIVHLYKLQEDISQLTRKNFINPLNAPVQRVIEEKVTSETRHYAEISKKISDRVLDLIKGTLKEESLCIKKLIVVRLAGKTRKLFNNTARISGIILICILSIFGYYNFFDIEGIYKNNFIKSANDSLNSTPYPTGLKDSRNPTINKLNQRKRLSHINDLNSKYFKPLIIFLAPNLDLQNQKQVVSSLSIPSNLKDEIVLKQVRKILAGTIHEQEWKSVFNKLLGTNVLTELNSYGAIANFLMPPLSNSVIIDNNKMIKVIYSLPEKEILRKDLIIRSSSLNSTDLEPKNYINKYDVVYSNIHTNCNLLLKRIKLKRSQLINLYRKTSDKTELIKIRDSLNAIAVIEVNLNNLQEKIRERHDYIVRNNTYRLEME